MLARALDAGVPAAWVTADEAYGKDCKFRSWLEQRRTGYVVAVACNQVVPGSAGTSRADVLAAHAPEQAWKRPFLGAHTVVAACHGHAHQPLDVPLERAGQRLVEVVGIEDQAPFR